jgi:hypothetical protein
MAPADSTAIGGGGPLERLELLLQSFYNLAAEAERYRLQLIACQEWAAAIIAKRHSKM